MSDKANDLQMSIDSIAGQSTERKSPPQSKDTGTPIQPTTVNNVKDETFSGTYDPENENKQNEETEQTTEADKKSVEASGQVGAYLIGGMIETVFGLTERLVYMSKFSREEKETILEIQEKDESEFSEYDNKVNRKFLAITKNHEEKRKRIPLSTKDEEMLAKACEEYSRVTGKTMNPNLILWSSIIKIFASRGIDIFLD